jgi:hypothetical protein
MKKTLAAAVITLGAMLLPLGAYAQAYLGINYTQLEQDNSIQGATYGSAGNPDKTFETGEVFIRLGGIINKYVSTELRAGTTAASKNDSTIQNAAPGKDEYRFNYHAGLYAKLSLPLWIFRPYGLVGYTVGQGELNRTPADVTKKEDLHDWSYGAGLDIDLGKHFGLNAEYVQYYNISGDSYKGPSAGIYYRF